MQERCRVLANRVVAPEHNLLTVATREIGRRAKAGQFAQIRVPGGAVFLPRPFSFLSADADRCTFLSRSIGPGTRALAGLPEGTEVDLLGPLGHGFDLSVAAAGEVILVGGGVGVPPLVHAAAELPLTGTALIGAARAEFLLCEQQFADLGWQVRPATDDGSRGHRGFVTDLLQQELVGASRHSASAVPVAATVPPDEARPPANTAGRTLPPTTVLACGPHAMLHRCAELVAAAGVTCQVALEEPMACGFGVCLGCAIRVRTPNPDDPAGPAYALVCRDGPVFPADQILW